MKGLIDRHFTIAFLFALFSFIIIIVPIFHSFAESNRLFINSPLSLTNCIIIYDIIWSFLWSFFIEANWGNSNQTELDHDRSDDRLNKWRKRFDRFKIKFMCYYYSHSTTSIRNIPIAWKTIGGFLIEFISCVWVLSSSQTTSRNVSMIKSEYYNVYSRNAYQIYLRT